MVDADCLETNCCFKTICQAFVECRPSRGLSTPVVAIIIITILIMLGFGVRKIIKRMKKKRRKQKRTLVHATSRTEDLTAGNTNGMSVTIMD